MGSKCVRTVQWTKTGSRRAVSQREGVDFTVCWKWKECVCCLAAVHVWIKRRFHTVYIYLLGAVSGTVLLSLHHDKCVFMVIGIFNPRSGLPLWAINQCHCDPEVPQLYRNSTLNGWGKIERMNSRKGEPQLYLFNLNRGRKSVTEEDCFIVYVHLIVLCSLKQWKYQQWIYILWNRKYRYIK